MADTLLVRALKGKPKSLNLSNKKLDRVPKAIGKLDCIVHLQLKNNKLTQLPYELSYLYQDLEKLRDPDVACTFQATIGGKFAPLIGLRDDDMDVNTMITTYNTAVIGAASEILGKERPGLQILNLGNNDIEELPDVLEHLTMLEKLHLFNNKLKTLTPKVLTNLRSLTFLNLNTNQLKSLPSEICRLINLQHLSMDNNLLTELPVELCALTRLEELHIANNQLIGLPLEFGFLINLEKLHLQKNRIRELPESIGKCYKLRMLDIAANDLRIFPTELNSLPLKDLYCEENPLLQHIPVHSVQEEEVLSLKEVSARYVMKELKDRWSYLRRAIKHYSQIRDMLAQASKCAVCGESFLNTWLECVRFVDAKGDLKLQNLNGLIPIRALLCSYKCFNSKGHDYYGVAFP